MQAAARSHRPLGLWDVAIPGPDDPRLDAVARIAVAESACFAHYGGFIVAAADGEPVAGLSAYDAAHKTMGHFVAAIDATLAGLDWSVEHRMLVGSRLAPLMTCVADTAPGVWVVEWVAALPAARGRGVANALLLEILERGRCAGYDKAQIAHLLGNTPAQRAYERVGFETVDEKRHPDFEAVFGSPGIARMMLDL
jgi:ribosomal protein S18 acetylase RimI-like enzyme